MPKTVERTRKAIAKKKGPIDALHQYSRDSKRLHRAQIRDEKLEKIAASRRKADQPYIERVTFFQEALRQNGGQPFDLSTVQDLIKTFVHQYDEDLAELRKTRRPGRPASTKEDLLKVKITSLQTEYDDHGFLLPALDSESDVLKLERWEGNWSYLTTLKWMRVFASGKTQPSVFPPKGGH
ncbi:translation machinery-associated protein 16 [Xylariomycetidae sp. FL2044]|nr:translation machinery-associated protein 16 [Xylariomycetidae sp. FL2044]